MIKVLGFDVETTGFKAGTDVITEIGAVFFHWHAPGKVEILAQYNGLIYDEGQPPQTAFIEKLTGITNEKLKAEGKPLLTAKQAIIDLCNACQGFDFIMAHNAKFDKTFFQAMFGEEHPICKIPWICTLSDMTHPETSKSKKLAHLALDYGCTVNPKELHRAVADVQLMIDMVAESKVDLNELIGNSTAVKITVRAMVPKPFGPGSDGGKGKDKARACGFGWDGKMWTKQIKETDYDREKEALGYDIAIIKG